MRQQRILRLVLGDQLNEKHPWFQQVDNSITYVMMEIRQETDYVNHHIQKIAAFFAAMRAFADRLREMRHRVIYLKLDDTNNQQTIAANIKALQAWENNPSEISIQQIEGFVRQILGWREYMRGIYWTHMPDLSTTNFFDHSAPLPKFYWTGDTRMNCLKYAVRQSLEHAYAHHIQRLMVTGNFALLAGAHPDAVDEWYLGIYIDAVEWVELPNTPAMSQFADGGRVATKPYVSTARYIHAMSDYCGSCTYAWQQRYGEGACPFNSLYWHFFHRNRRRLKKIPRIGMMYRTWDRMGHREQRRILRQADSYRHRLNAL